MNRFFVGLLVRICILSSCVMTYGGNYEINYSKVDRSGWNCYLCEFQRFEYRDTNLNSKLLVSADGNARFGRESGIDGAGSYASMDGSFVNTNADGWVTRLEFQNLGLEGRTASVGFFKVGKMGLVVDRQNQPNLRDEDALTPFRVVGNDILLSQEWVSGYFTGGFDELERENQPVYLRTERQSTSLKYWYRISSTTKVNARVFKEHKSGVEQTYRDSLYQSSAFPRPIDWSVQGLDSSLEFVNSFVAMSVKYQSSDFRNTYRELRWQSAYTDEDLVRNSAYEPSHRMQKLEIGGSFRLHTRTQLHISAEETRTNQVFSTLLPYTYNQNLHAEPTGLETTGLDQGRKHWAIGVSHQQTSRFRWRFSKEQNQRTDHRPFNVFRPVVGDVYLDIERSAPSYDVENNRTRFSFTHQFRPEVRIHGGIEKNKLGRSKQEINTNTTDKKWLGISADLSASWQLQVNHALDMRDASSFIHPTLNNPLTRRFHQAARRSKESEAMLSFNSAESFWTSNLSFTAIDWDYPKSILGLQGEQLQTLGWYLGYRVPNKRDLGLSVGFQDIQSRTHGSDWTSNGNWGYHTDDGTYSFTLKYQEDEFLRPSIKLELEAATSFGTSDYITQTSSDRLAFTPLKSATQRVEMRMTFGLIKKSPVVLFYVWESFKSVDWANDGIGQTSIWNVLPMRRGSSDYVNQLVGISIGLKLR